MKLCTFACLWVLLAQIDAAGAQHSPLSSPQRAYETGAGAMLPNTPYRPNEHALADLDGDGTLDVACAQIGNFLTPQVSVAFNDGDGNFGAPLFLAAPGETAAVCAADLDGDGDVDLAFTQSSEGGQSGQSVVLYRNQGAGTFDAPVSIPCGKGPTAIRAVDFDLDGDLDLLTVNRKLGESDVSLLSNDGTAHFTRTDFPVGPEPYRMVVGDLNGDGRPDVVTTHVGPAPPAVTVSFNTGSGLSAPVGLLTGAAQLAQPGPIPAPAIGDVDNDGDLDVMYGYAPSAGNALALWKNAGNGTFAAVSAIESASNAATPWSMELVDVTNDGVLDLVTCGGQALSWWGFHRGLGGGAFALPETFASGEYSRWITAADIDADGDRDVVITNHGLMTVQVHRNDAGTFPAFDHLDAVDSYRCQIADVDGDGDLDIVALAVSIYTYINDGNGSFTRLSYFGGPGRFRNFLLRDLDGDGRPEMLKVKDPSSAPYHFYTNKNLGAGTWGPNQQWTLPASCGVYHFTALDFDNDGDLDVACNESGGCPSKPANQIYLLANQGDGTFGAATTINKVQWGISDIDSADLDGDGNADLVGVGSTQFNGAPAPTSGYVVLHGNGNGTFGTPVSHPLDPFILTITVRAVDMNADGAVDLIGAGLGTWGSTDQVVVMLNDLAGGFIPFSAQPAPKSLSYNGTNGIAFGDFSHDGLPDVVVGGGEDAVLYINDGEGRLLPGLRHGIGGQALWVATGDLNADGLLDVAAIALRMPVITLSEQVSVLFGQPVPAWTDAGSALAGAIGTPLLKGAGTLAVGSACAVTLSHAAGSAPAGLFVALASTPVPFKGGTLLPFPMLLTLVASTSPAGGIALPFTMPAGFPAGTTLWLQWAIQDAGAVQGAALSNAISGLVP